MGHNVARATHIFSVKDIFHRQGDPEPVVNFIAEMGIEHKITPVGIIPVAVKPGQYIHFLIQKNIVDVQHP